MVDSSARNDDIRETVEKYRDSILRFAYAYLKNRAEAEDIAQDVFITYIENSPLCETEGKKKAWLMKVTANKCKTLLSSVWKKRVTEISDDLSCNRQVAVLLGPKQRSPSTLRIEYGENIFTKENRLHLW